MDYIDMAREFAETKFRLTFTWDMSRLSTPDRGESFVLEYLARANSAVNPKELRDAMNVSSARMAAIINQLEAKKYVKRLDDPENGKYILVELLSDGKEKRRKAKEDFEMKAAVFLEALGEDASEYIRILNKIADIFSKS